MARNAFTRDFYLQSALFSNRISGTRMAIVKYRAEVSGFLKIKEDHMIQLDSGNVLLKPSHRRQVMTWLKRALRMGERLGDFVLQISMKRIGRAYEVCFAVHDSAGDFSYRMKRHDWRDAVRDLSRMLCVKLQGQRMSLA